MARLGANSYGKSSVRLTKVVRSGALHTLLEMTVDILLGGEFQRVYTHGENDLCIPTDTMKNTVYALARLNGFDSPESLGKILTAHFIESFPHVAWAEASIEQTLWERIDVDGSPHPHAFTSAGHARRTGRVRRARGEPASVSGGIAGLEVIKTTGSGFSGFLRDQYTTLPETDDRILATSIDAVWDFPGSDADWNGAFETARRSIPRTFALHDSRSVQQTIYAMGEALLAAVPAISSVSFTLPNRHRLAVNLEPFHLASANEIFTATSEPFGLITGTVVRE
ncbi:MAG: factor-independent urate hydroxylase [Spirochaetia bacterium]|jgi:urate oxidase